ncbi:MAG TPA: hypothetical protein VKI17_12850 [Gemmataceae bacterium]|nr:hypothetical protein [Gemmataceae bacterium]
MVTLEQYKEATCARRRRDYSALTALLVVLLISAYAIPLSLALLLRPYEHRGVEACAQWVIQQGIGPTLTLLIGLLATFAVSLIIGLPLALPAIGMLQRLDRDTRRDRRLFCPHCDARLGCLATVTGNCQRCGAQALDIPQKDTTAADQHHRLLTVEEFNAAIRNRLNLKDPKQRDPRLRCPSCQADLTGKRSQIVATRQCPRCEAPVLEDPENTPLSAGSHSNQRLRVLSDFRVAHSAYCRWSLFGGMLLVCLACVPGLVAVSWETPLRRLLGPVGSGVLLFLACVVGAGLVAGAGWLINRRVHRSLRLDCPHCSRSLFETSGIVIATRRCHHCGRRALVEEDTIPSDLSPANAS